MRKILERVFALALVSMISMQLNCVATVHEPPPPREEIAVAPAAYPGAVWVKGHWKWKRWGGRWVWVPGHWQVMRRGVWVIVR